MCRSNNHPRRSLETGEQKDGFVKYRSNGAERMKGCHCRHCTLTHSTMRAWHGSHARANGNRDHWVSHTWGGVSFSFDLDCFHNVGVSHAREKICRSPAPASTLPRRGDPACLLYAQTCLSLVGGSDHASQRGIERVKFSNGTVPFRTNTSESPLGRKAQHQKIQFVFPFPQF